MATLQEEAKLHGQGYRLIAGLDEAGRGCWAGPVVAGAVILPLDAQDLAETLSGVHDSKQLLPAEREHLYPLICRVALSVGVGLVPPRDIDRLGIVLATRAAMAQAVAALALRPDFLLIDFLELPQVEIPQKGIAKGDALSLSIAAASIVAKVFRDRVMAVLERDYPGYGFARHKGYGTPEHRAMLARLGPCPIHRFSYSPVAAARDAFLTLPQVF
ncbi:MAG: ribonuclease HII [Anaerolineae bacterium]